ncbi:hypothetical protein [Maribacter aestuarii]|uniref:hypothetical protein n=1 Tax=Maribacter aestuarii TaxID=1130723 RepID=UPI00248AA987|nr:hypothetical protein [Maribacter aestuarii]
MEPDKFEKYIKSKLEEREITPSADVWAKISSQLDTENKRPNRRFFWYGVAASVLVIIGIVVFYNNSGIEEGSRNDNSIVETPIIGEIDEKPDLKTNDITPDALVLEQTKDGKGTNSKKAEDEASKMIENKMLLEDSGKQEIAQKSTNREIFDTAQIAKVPEHVLDSKIAEVVVQVDMLELSTEVSDAEVDSLLRKAQEDILRQRLFNVDNTVDAMALLTEVEEELDQSFRDQIFQSLKAGFLKVRTAVADRNN